MVSGPLVAAPIPFRCSTTIGKHEMENNKPGVLKRGWPQIRQVEPPCVVVRKQLRLL